MLSVRHSVALLLLAFPVVTIAAGQPYMSLVGELLGAVESPRMVRDFCAAKSPATVRENAQAFEAWHTRHTDLLSAVELQVERANQRLKRQGAPGGERPIAALYDLANRQIATVLGGKSAQDIASFCRAYPTWMKTKDNEAATSIPKLLDVVTHADKVLSERERT